MALTWETTLEVDGLDETVEVTVGGNGIESVTIMGGERDGEEAELSAAATHDVMQQYYDSLEEDREARREHRREARDAARVEEMGL